MLFRRLPDKPLVAFLGRYNELEVLERHGDIICKSTRTAVLIRQIIVLVCGSLLSTVIWLSISRPERFPLPLFWKMLVALLAAPCDLIFIRNLFGTPRFEVNGATGEISLFKHRTNDPWKKIYPSEIAAFRLEIQPYITDEERRPDNLVLLLISPSGKRRALCGSPDQKLVRSLAESLARKTQRSVEEAPWAGKRGPDA